MKYFKKYNLWRGVFSALISFLIVSIGLSSVAFAYEGSINAYLGIDTSITTSTTGETIYKSDYGELSDESLAELISDEIKYAQEEMEEGAVLLKNNGALPLDTGEVKNITLFGRASEDLIYKSSSGGASASANNSVSLKDALEGVGFNINETLYDAYADSSTVRVKSSEGASDIGEEDIDFYTDSIINSFSSYNDAAIVVLAREGGEGTDFNKEDADGVRQLSLHDSEAAMLELINEYFDTIIVLLNTGTSMELGWIDEDKYGIDACMWIGQPGRYGTYGVASLLIGDANPSGHLTDTYAYNSLSSPASVNFGDFTFSGDTSNASTTKYVVYQEGIYVGYKYYETRYEDYILSRYGASDPVGSTVTDASEWNYNEEVQFPFGYGLSYTTFSQTLDSVAYNESTDEFEIKVTVTNTGEVAGKSVAQIYVQTPYIEGGIEKASVQIVGFGKTEELDEDESQTLTITVDRYLLASYDDSGDGTYVLDAGTYYFGLGDNSHDALNNILALKGVTTGMTDIDGTATSGNAEKADGSYVLTDADYSYAVSEETGETIKNAFTGDEAIDINDFYENDVVTYLTRSDWDGTYPTEAVSLTINETLENAMISRYYEYDSSTTDALTEDQINGVDKDILFMDMHGVDYDDDKWDDFLDQLSISDMATIISDSLGQPSIASVSKPANKNADGPDGYGMSYSYGDKDVPTAYNAQYLAVSSWSYEIMQKRGSFYAEDMLFSRGQMAWAPGLNLHRTPLGGRSAEYSSEDAVFTALMASVQVAAMAEKGAVVTPKHFFANDQETNRSTACTFMTEQTAREVYLRAFELPLKSGAGGSMHGMNRIGAKALPVSKASMSTIAMEEWGFNGIFITDSSGSENDKIPTVESLLAGTGMFCLALRTTTIYNAIMENSDSYLYEVLREANHRYYYQYANSNLVNGLTAETVVGDATPWWKTAIIAIEVGIGVLAAGSLVAFVVFGYIKKNEDEEVQE